jgi:hypothetical protein
MDGIRKAEPRQPGQVYTPNYHERCNVSINENDRRRIPRFDEEDVLSALREALSQKPEWCGFSPRELSVVVFLWGYLPTPPSDFEVEAALPFALEDREGAA